MGNDGRGGGLSRPAMVSVVFLVVVGSAFALRLAWRKYFPDTLAQASIAYEQGDWPSAIRLGREVLRDRPDDPETLRLMARSSARLGRDDAAMGIYKKLDKASLQPADFLGMGLSLEHKGMPDEAREAWQKGLTAGPAWAPSLEELAWFLFRKHRYEDATQVAESLGRLPGWEPRSNMVIGNLRATLNDIPGATEYFRRSIGGDPKEVDRSSDPVGLRKLIARVFLKADHPAEARAMLLPILEKGPDREASWLLSRVYLRGGDRAKARKSLALAGTYRADNPLELDPGPYVGEARCEKCHSEIYKDSLANRHTQTYYRGDQLRNLPRPAHALPDPDDPKVTHSIEERDGTLRERTQVGDKVYNAVIEYAFGTDDRYLTSVNRDDDGRYRIARMSYYQTADGKGWDRSALDSIHASVGDEFQGEMVGVRDGVIKCLYCHVTNSRGGKDRVGPETADRAIGCERCHGPGGNHLAAMSMGFPEPAIVSPAAATPASVSAKQCNDCHILDRSFTQSDPEDRAWVRSQGVGWTLSRCNTESGGAFGCVTCHDPHKSARTTTVAHYEAKCVSCHTVTASVPATQGREASGAKTTVCPVNPAKGCVGCHMPKVRVDSLHLDLSDHYIRVKHKPAPDASASQAARPSTDAHPR